MVFLKVLIKKFISDIFGVASFVSSRRRDYSEVETIFIILMKPLGIGDFLMLSPYIPGLVKKFSECDVFLISDHPPYFECDGLTWISPSEIPRVDYKKAMLISPDVSFRGYSFLKIARYKVGYFFSSQPYSNFLGRLPRVDLRRQHYAIRIKNLFQELGVISADYGYEGIQFKKSSSASFFLERDYVVIAPVSNWSARQYPLERFQHVVRELSEKIQVVLVGSAEEGEIWNSALERNQVVARQNPKVVDLMGTTNLQELVGLCVQARLCIANDSGPAHIGSVSCDHTLVIYGCCSPESRRPLVPPVSNRVEVMSNGNSCRHFPCFEGFGEPVCRNESAYSCLDVDQGTVVNTALRILELE